MQKRMADQAMILLLMNDFGGIELQLFHHPVIGETEEGNQSGYRYQYPGKHINA